MGNNKKQQTTHPQPWKTPAVKPGSVTCLLKEYADRVSDHGDPNMAPTVAHTDSQPQSPATSESSTDSKAIDIREILKNLPSKCWEN
ncbi:Hypothetical predicted protein [Pelobates cultripes]|uniref:Uncharacterized protein n=1 Tax=Pelobates cultripes TaxID=61616 RepID=A0AAD1W630_PELCU|nr:Hypothetical predicted protein [Pelobates cultripes]